VVNPRYLTDTVQDALCTIPAIKSYEGPEIVEMIHDWLNTCQRDHPKCRKSLCSVDIKEDTHLFPGARILDIGFQTTDPVKLIDADGLKARYCVLSHCWGDPRGPRPTCVTSDNQRYFMEGVRITELAKTFQDAIHLSRSLSIRYLWIDSMCIVQDSSLHWQKESKRMGSIYEGAYLRIAAAGAHNSAQGLFFEQDTGALFRQVSFPLSTDGSHNLGLVHIRAAKKGPKWPRDGPLVDRAWVFQE
jgi:hypothetical protein